MKTPIEYEHPIDRNDPTKIHKYRIGLLDARKQLQVARRLMGAMGEIGRREAREARSAGTLVEASQVDDGPSEPDPTAPSRDDIERAALGFFVRQALFELSDADCETVLVTCLGVCARWDENAAGGSWRPVIASGSSLQLRDGDVGLDEMTAVALRVIEHNLGNFLFGAAAA